MEYWVYQSGFIPCIAKCNTEAEARERIAKCQADWRSSGAPRIPSYQIIWNRDGRVVASIAGEGR